jgi:uncharacterized protein
MNFKFDSNKARINLSKHGISFAELEPVFYDDLALTREDEDALEQRFITVGLDAQLRLVAVCWTQRQENIRLISARLATSNERKAYENRI